MLISLSRLDSIADSIASSTFGVINKGQIRTADMGGKNSHFLHTYEIADSKHDSRHCEYVGFHRRSHQESVT